MSKDDAQNIADDLLFDSKPGEEVSFQSQGQLDNDHYHSRQRSGDKRNDGWAAEKSDGGDVATEEIHTDDE